jgi:solute carrier family 38 (sodium-coupled neutral amino acid transporter), member 11
LAWDVGIFFLALVAYLNYRSVLMLIECGLIANKLDLEELSQHYLGDRGYYFALSAMFLFAFGGQIAYMVIIGDTIPAVTEQFISADDSAAWLTDRRYVTAFVAVFIMLPICLMRELSSLSIFSFFSVLSYVVITIILASCAPSIAHSQGNYITADRFTWFNINLFAGIGSYYAILSLYELTNCYLVGSMSFSFVCQHNSFLIYRSLKQPSLENWNKVALLSIFFSFCVILTFGLAGYINFGFNIHGDVLTNFPFDYPPASGKLTYCPSTIVL